MKSILFARKKLLDIIINIYDLVFTMFIFYSLLDG
jgi:hypothetical protein